MRTMVPSEWRRFVAQWRQAGPALERVKRDELRRQPYDSAAVESLLALGDRWAEPRTTSGLVELQRWLQKLAEQQVQAPLVAEAPARYVVSKRKPRPRKEP